VSWIAIAAVTGIMTVSAILQGAIGFGLGLVAIPFLMYLDLRFVPAPLLVAALTLHMLVLRRDRSGVDRSGLTMLLSGRVLGTIPAAMLLAQLPLNGMKILLAGIVIAGSVMAALHSGGPATRRVLFKAGVASGFMATAAGLGGPPVALVYQRETGLRLRGTLAAYFIVGTVISLAALALAGRFGAEEIRLSAFLIPGTVLGYAMSHPAAAYLDSGRTRAAVLAVSALSAVSVILTVLI
jgi:uncharacterized protein